MQSAFWKNLIRGCVRFGKEKRMGHRHLNHGVWIEYGVDHQHFIGIPVAEGIKGKIPFAGRDKRQRDKQGERPAAEGKRSSKCHGSEI